MTPHSLSTVKLSRPKPLDLYQQRHGPYAKGAVLPATQAQSCPSRRVADFPPGFIPPRLYERNLEQNQLLASCCRHPENHMIEGRKSHPDEPCTDIYVFHCHCGRKHVRFCVGMEDTRPEWK